MDKFMPEVSKEERIQILQNEAFKIEKGKYQKSLSLDELTARREDLAENYITLDIKKTELDEITSTYKNEMKPLKDANKEILQEIRTKQTTIDGVLYHLANENSGFMETYDEDGELITTRRMRPDERVQTGSLYAMKSISNQ